MESQSSAQSSLFSAPDEEPHFKKLSPSWMQAGYEPLMAEWWTQQPEPKWGPKDTGREEWCGNYVNGHPVQKSEQEMEPLKRKMKCKWRGKKDTVLFKDDACGWTPIEVKMGPKFITAQSVF